MPGSEPRPRFEPDITPAPSWAEPALELVFFSSLLLWAFSVFYCERNDWKATVTNGSWSTWWLSKEAGSQPHLRNK